MGQGQRVRPTLLAAYMLVVLAGCGGGGGPNAGDAEVAGASTTLAADTSEPKRNPQASASENPATSEAAPESQAAPEAAPQETLPTPQLATPAPKRVAPARPTRRQVARSAVSAELAQRRLFVGFHDDPSFRWQRDRGKMLDLARDVGATVLRTTVEWRRIAPERPANASDPFDPAYRLDGIDELVRSAQRRGLEVLLTIWGTPDWANGGLGPNRAPRRLRDLTAFATALSSRYSGRTAGYPFVRFYSIWNEPNLEQFLAPQFDRKGRSVSPTLYAKLFQFAAAGIRKGSPNAFVAAGETSPRGRDKPTDENVQDSHAPATFARLVAQAAPDLGFDAWAHHPYPTALRRPPTQLARWPNVALVQVPRLATSLDSWFKRRDTPVWITEYAYQTRPHDPNGVTALQQASFAAQALSMASRMPRVEMFVWFTLRDDSGNPWQSGLVNERGAKKPSFARFGRSARPLDGRLEVVDLRGGTAILRMGVREFAHVSNPGAPVGITYHLAGARRLLADAQPRVKLGPDGWVTLRVPLRPVAGERYTLQIVANDEHGQIVSRDLVLVGH